MVIGIIIGVIVGVIIDPLLIFTIKYLQKPTEIQITPEEERKKELNKKKQEEIKKNFDELMNYDYMTALRGDNNE